MAFEMEYKQQQQRSRARSTADSRSGGGGARRHDSPRQGPLPSPRRSPSPTGDEQKMSGDYCDPHDCIQHGGQTKLYVGNISPDAREHDLEAAFGRYGRVQRVYLHPRNYGFIVFYEAQAADAARSYLDGQVFLGNRIIVGFAKDPKLPQYDNDNDDVDRYNCYGQRGDNSKLFVSNISEGIEEYHIEGLFSRHGRVRNVYLKGKHGFVDFYDPQHACNARRDFDGKEFGWTRFSVEFATGVQSIPGDSTPICCDNRRTCRHESSSDSKAGDWKDWCYQCGKKGHSSQNCRNSRNDLGFVAMLEDPSCDE